MIGCAGKVSGHFGVLSVYTHVNSAPTPATAPERRLTAEDVMTAREVAQLLHAPISTVEDWARRAILPSVKVGRRRLYIRQNIEAVLTTGAKQG